MGDTRDSTSGAADMLRRQTLCLSGTPGSTIHRSDEGFEAVARSAFNPAENDAAERLVLLKARLRELADEEFWRALSRELASILAAQYVVVSKRRLPSHGNALAEIPERGTPGNCFSNLTFHFAGEGDKPERSTGGFDYPAKGTLCAHMMHDKVFLVPGHLADFIQERAADFEVPVETYFAVPLSHDGKCFAHIGVFWSLEGEKGRKLSWGIIEMLLHALEDLTAQRLVAQHRKRAANAIHRRRGSMARAALAASFHSLKPYARSLSHELRTPMHGVVGMLDIMHVTVQDALESHGRDPALETLLRTLRENIETIQDSSRRAVEAADNIVHAYDFDMQVPGSMDLSGEATAAVAERSGEMLGSPDLAAEPATTGHKRRRSASMDISHLMPSPKQRILEEPAGPQSPHAAALRNIVKESSSIANNEVLVDGDALIAADAAEPSPSTPSAKVTRVRDIIQVVVNESLRFGDRPDSAIATQTQFGEKIDVHSRGANGEASVKLVEWSVDPSVPEEIQMDERDFAKLVSVLFLNALKFTDGGSVKLRANLSPRSRFIVVKVIDTGRGIDAAFRPYLFKAFSQGDDSLTRQNEGLGLGLMVAKGLARRVGGDLVCVRSETEGPDRGSEFELRIPLTSTSGSSRSSTPSRTPTPLERERSETPSANEPAAEAAPAQRQLEDDNDTAPSTNSPPSPVLPLPTPRPPLARASTPRRRSQTTTMQQYPVDRELAKRFPLNVMVAEDNRINRKLLVNMLNKLGYSQVHEAFDGNEAVRLMEMDSLKPPERHIDVILMDLWMPNMDGYEAAQRILQMQRLRNGSVQRHVKILAVTADATDVALDRAREVGMQGIMTKPYKLVDLERLIVDHCPQKTAVA